MSQISRLVPFVDTYDVEWEGKHWRGVVNPWGVAIASEVEMAEFLYGFVRVLKPLLVIETGCHIGTTTQALAQALADNQRGSLLACDPDPAFVAEALKRVVGLPVEIRHCKSADLPIERCDFLYSDSSEDARVEELGRLKSGAVAVVHDTRLIPRLAAAAEEFSERVLIETARGFAIVRA